MVSRQGAVKHGFVSKIAGGCSSYDVIAPWPDLTWSVFFYQKLRKVCPIRYPNPKPGGATRRRFSLSAKNLRGGCTPPVRARVNPRPAGVWLVTLPAGGGPKGPPLRSPKLLDRFPNFKRHSIALYVNYPYKVKYLTRRSLMTSQVRSNSEFSTFRAWRHRRVKFRC